MKSQAVLFAPTHRGLKRFAALCLLLPGCEAWEKKVVPGTAPHPPRQVPLQEPPFEATVNGVAAQFQPRALYHLEAYALIKDTSMRDNWSDVADLDIAFGWGPIASASILEQLSFHLRRRYVSVRWGAGFPLGRRDVMRHLSNHHLIAATPEVAADLNAIKKGDRVVLDGKLVDVTVNGQTMRTSLSRDDIGSGACEVVYVTSLTQSPPEQL